MTRFVTRSIAMFLLSLALVGTLTAPALAKPGGNAAAAAECENGGYLNYVDADGNPFRNAGQCTRDAAQHDNTLRPVPTPPTTSATLSFVTLPTGAGFMGCYAQLEVAGYLPGEYDVTFHRDETFYIFVLEVEVDGTGIIDTYVDGGVSLEYSEYEFPVDAYVDGVLVDTATPDCQL